MVSNGAMPNHVSDLKARWKQNKARFEQLCSEQEELYSPEFERVFEKLSETAPEVRESLNVQGWNVLADLPESIDTKTLNGASAAAGASEDVARRFIRYTEIILEGKRLQQENLLINLEIENASRPQMQIPADGWRFSPISFFAPQSLHSAIARAIEEQAEKEDGIFTSATVVDDPPDEALDGLLGVDVYDVGGSLQPYLGELRRWNVTGKTLGKELTRALFSYLKAITEIIKANTDKPETMKKQILDSVTALDRLPAWGLIFQILSLQGIIHMLEHCPLQEGDKGYAEAQELHGWISELLGRKILWFTVTGDMFGDGDKERLQPLCDYLCSTATGRMVQHFLFPRNEEAAQTDATANFGKEEKCRQGLYHALYLRVLQVLRDTGRSFETKPDNYIGKDEEGIRDAFLTVLETHFKDCTATGETFNLRGKTDLLVKHCDGTNIFIGECKFWKGQKHLSDAIYQLFDRYLTWRDTRTALLIFVKQDNITDIVRKIKETCAAHEYFVEHGDSAERENFTDHGNSAAHLNFAVSDTLAERENFADHGNSAADLNFAESDTLAERESFATYETGGDENSLSYIFHLPGDPERHIHLEVLIFHFNQPA